MSPKLLKTFLNETISSLITRNAMIFVIDFFNHKYVLDFKKLTFFCHNKTKMSLFGLPALPAQFRVNQNKQNGQTFGEKVKLTKILIDWVRLLTTSILNIVMP